MISRLDKSTPQKFLKTMRKRIGTEIGEVLIHAKLYAIPDHSRTPFFGKSDGNSAGRGVILPLTPCA